MRLASPSAVVRGVISGLAWLAVGVAWIAAAPIGSSPDDSYHLTSIWCADGFEDGVCQPFPGDESKVLVPYPVANATCHAQQGTKSAECLVEVLARDDGRTMAPSDNGNLYGNRPGLYYRVMRPFVGERVLRSVVAMRVLNVLAALLVVGATFLVATRPVRRALVLTWMTTAVPMVVFLITSVNTNAWGFIGLGSLWAAVATAIRADEPWRRWAASGIAVLAVVMATGARREAPVYALLTVLALVVLTSRPEPIDGVLHGRSGERRATLLLTTVAIAAGVMALVRLDQVLDVAREFSSGYAALAERSGGSPWFTLLKDLPTYWTGALGDQWGLGWLDTPLPPVVYALTIASFGAALMLGLGLPARRKGPAVLVVLAGMVLYPSAVLIGQSLFVYEEFAPRHFLPMLVLLVAVSLLDDADRLRTTRGQRALFAGSAITAHAVALHVTLQRYTAGLPVVWFTERKSWGPFGLTADAGWWWSSGPGPMAFWVLGSAAFGLLVVLAIRTLEDDGPLVAIGRARTA
jgi:hypothetical protein